MRCCSCARRWPSSSASSSAPASSRRPRWSAQMTGSAPWMFAAWALGAAVSLVGALCYAELASAYPHAGGDYHFLLRAYGRRLAFLFGWARFAVITTGSIALLAFVFGDYMTQLLPLGRHSAALYAAALRRRAAVGEPARPAQRRGHAELAHAAGGRGAAAGRGRAASWPCSASGRAAAPRRAAGRRRRPVRSGWRWCSCC